MVTAGRQVNSQSHHWGTPVKYVDAVKAVFGGVVDLDPCSNEWSVVGAGTEFSLPLDGLEQEWDYGTIFVNPPHGRDAVRKTTIRDWLAKCADAHSVFGSEVLALVPVATNTRHWKEFVFPRATAVCFLSDTRLKFLENGASGGKGAPMACAMVYWGDDFGLFKSVFDEFGFVVAL